MKDIEKMNGIELVLGAAFCKLYDAGSVVGKGCSNCDRYPPVSLTLLPQQSVSIWYLPKPVLLIEDVTVCSMRILMHKWCRLRINRILLDECC